MLELQEKLMRIWTTLVCVFSLLATGLAHSVEADDNSTEQCGSEGVWVQILGAGAAELDDPQGGPSYLVWQDGQAKLLVNTAAGASVQFAKSGARINDLDAIVFNNLGVDRTVSLPQFIAASRGLGRDRLLPVLGPDGNDTHPGMTEYLNRLFGESGLYPALADFLTTKPDGAFKLSAREVPATGQRRWARFGSESLSLAAIPVNHGDTPALAWRVEIEDYAIVFTGSFNNAKNVIPTFAKNADALIIPHTVPETARGNWREAYVIPSQIGDIAAQAETRMLMLGQRANRTRGRETQSRDAIRESYEGPLIFGNDLECWGL